MKKGTIFIIVAAICMLLVIAFLPIKASAAGNDDFLYEVLNEEEVEIHNYIGIATDVTIPSSIDGYPVTRLFGNVFSGTEVTSISIPNSVTNIDALNAFYDCPNLAEINVSLDNPNFSSDSGVLFNKDKTSLLKYPSAKTDTTCTIPGTVQYIEGRAFDMCTNLQSFSVTSTDYFITDAYGVLYTTLNGSSVFNLLQYPIGNTRQSFTIPAAVEGIGEDAFKGCTYLISIEVDPSNLFFLSEGGVVYSYDKNYDDEKVKTILEVYPAGKTDTDFAIPDTVTTCSNFAFFGAGYLENLDIPAGFAIWWNSDALGGCCFDTISVDSGNPYLKVQDGVLFDYSMTILYKYPALDTRTSYAIPGNCDINQYAFSGSANLTGITFPQYVTNINPHAFEDCTGLNSVTLAYNTYKVSWNAFKNCSNLAYASFTNTPPSVIEQGAFLNCASGFKIRYHSGALTWTTPAMWGIPTQPCGMVTFLDGYNSLQSVLSPLGTTLDAPTPPMKAGYMFVGWYKDYSLQTPWNFSTDKLTANDMALYAKWTSFAQYTITVKTGSTTAGSATGSGSFMTGDTVKVSATPKNGYRFVRWLESGNTVSTSAEYSFTVTKSRILTAEFAAIGTPALSFGYPSYCKLQLKWPAVAGAAGYEVSRKDPGTTNYTALPTITETSFIDTGLSCGSNYTYRVRAYCVAGPGYDPTYGPYTTKTAAPKWPSITGFTAARGTGYQTAQLMWNQVTDAQGYEVWRSTSSLKGYALLATVTTGTSCMDETMNGGYTYYYKVRPYAAVDSGTSYGAFSAYKYAKPFWPSVKLISAALKDYHSAVLSWSAIQNIDGYAVFRSTSEYGRYTEIAAVPSETTTYTDETLNGGYTYYYKIKPYITVEGKGIYGNFSNIKYIKPAWAPITLLSAARESGSYHNAALTWSSSPVAEGYSVFRGTSAAGTFTEIATDLTELIYKDQTMNGGYTYYYKVKPYIMVGTAKVYGSFSNAKYVKPAWPAITLRAPVLHGYHTVDLSWTVVAGADGYSVFRNKSYSGLYTEIVSDLTGTVYTDELPTGGTVYYYKIRPYIKVGETKVYGNFSNYKYMSAKWPAITLAVKMRSYNSLQLDWTNINGADGYEVQRGTISSSIKAYKDVLTNSLTEEGLEKGTYYYKVRAFNVIGEGEQAYRVYSAYCTVKSGKPGWPAITLKVTNNSYNSLKLDWNDLAGITGYNVYRNTRYTEPYTRIAEGIVPSEYIDNKNETGLSTGTTYYYKIEPCDGSVIGPRSAYKSGKPAWPVPTLTVKADQYDRLKLNWTSVNGADGYDVFRATSYKGPFTVPVNTETITITEHVNYGLKTGVTYYYKVKPYVMAGGKKVYGTASSYKSAKVIPAAPAGLNVSQIPSASIGVSWNPVEGAAKYEVYRSTSAAGTFLLVKTTDLNEYIDKTGLVNGKTYYYKVRAYVLVGTSTKVYSIYSAAIPLKLTPHTPYTGPGSWQLIDQTGGTTKALMREGNTLYVGVGLHVMIFDVTDPKNIKVLGNSPLLPQYVESITCDGAGHLFVSCGSGGLVILDVTRPSSISILGSLDTRGYTEGVTLYGQYAVLADGPQGVQIANISNLTEPEIVSEAYPLAYAYDAAIKNNIAYVAAGGSGLLVIDLSDPESPQEKGLIELGGFQYDVETAGNKLYTAGAWGGVFALDLSEPLEPPVINTTSTTGWAMAIQIQNTSMLVMDGADGAMLYDISGTQPVLKSTYTKGGFIMAGALSGKSAFVLDKEKGLMNVDFSISSSPQLISRWMPILDGRRVTISGSTGYVAGGLSGMHAIDLSDWNHPVDTYWYDTEGGYANKVIVDGKTAYLSTHLDTKSPMVTFNISNPLKPVKLGAVPNDQAVFNTAFRSMTLENKHIYIPGEFYDASVDVSDPRYPRVVNRISMENPVNAASSGDLLITTNSYQLQLVDISDPNNMRLISTLAKNTSGEAITFINPTTIITAADPGIWIVDVSDPGNPQKKAELAVSGSVMDICIDGNTAYLSTLGNGVNIVDIADPLNPALKGSVSTLGMAYDCSVQGDLMLVADSYAGLSIYQYGPESGESVESASYVRTSLPLLLNEKPESFSNDKSSNDDSYSAASENELSYVVTSASDSGSGTLRGCLENLEANTTVTFDTTVFDPNSPATIRLETILPGIYANNITIDASNAGVILDGSMLSDGNGLTIYSSDDKIMGLQILNFPQNGIRVEGERNQIGGSRNVGNGPIGQGNLTSGNKLYGIHVYGRDHLIEGNLIGTDVTGTEAMPNYDGLFVSEWAFYITVGGVNPGEGNVISGNDFINLDTWGDHTRIIGNILGLDITGTKKVQASTSNNLVMESGSMNTTAGGTTPQERNIISGAQLGVVFSDPNSYQNSVIGNYIGTDITGTIAIPNQTGVIIWTTGNHRIGGTADGERNLISGNQNGIQLNGYGVADNIILGNWIGVDASGNNPLPNDTGISINMGQHHAVIGGYAPEEGNLISGGSISMRISNPGIVDNYIAGNTIRNASVVGVYFEDYSSKNFVQCNIFGNMAGNAVRVDYGSGNEIRGNSFTGNPLNMIYLNENGNLNLPAPVISSADNNSVSGTAGAGCLVEVFVIEGSQVIPLGFSATDTEGRFTYQSSQPLTGKQVVSLATDAFCNTSVFSSAFIVN